MNMLKWIARNKYKLMVLIPGLYLIADVAGHRGLTRVLLPKTFPAYYIDSSYPANRAVLVSSNKEWVKAVNTKGSLDKIGPGIGGIECDVYFNAAKQAFEIHHDPDKATGFTLNQLLEGYKQKELTASIWIDLKNLDDSNYHAASAVLTSLRNSYGLRNKMLVESARPELLAPFSDSGFYTSYYIPLFNPYLVSSEEIKQWTDSLASLVHRSKVSAISGYYFQYPFLHHYFPNYPILTWAANDRFSLVNWLFKKKAVSSREIFIILYP